LLLHQFACQHLALLVLNLVLNFGLSSQTICILSRYNGIGSLLLFYHLMIKHRLTLCFIFLAQLLGEGGGEVLPNYLIAIAVALVMIIN
jgi:hypothetical protein